MPKTFVALALFAASCSPALALASLGQDAAPQNTAAQNTAAQNTVVAGQPPSATALLDAAAARPQTAAYAPDRRDTDFGPRQAGIWGVAILATGLIAATLRRRRFVSGGFDRTGGRGRRRRR